MVRQPVLEPAAQGEAVSWEGYYQNVGECGHYYESNALLSDPPKVCPTCGDRTAWSHAVDSTNGCEDRGDGLCNCGMIEMDQFLRESVACPTCGCSQPRFDVPSDTTPHKAKP